MLQAQQPITNRPLSCLKEDVSALNAVAQAAVNVELFTIPLYMTSLYSIYGTHQINGNNDFYQGRLWPGLLTTNLKDADPGQPGKNAYDTYGNKVAFNGIFSVFIAEMLHLQLASNICSAIGVKSTFTGAPLQNKNFGWTCYGDDNTVLPHILKFTDCKNFGAGGKDAVDDDKDNPLKINYKDIKVKLGPVDNNQVNLFLAIEETEAAAHKILENPEDYFPKIPFKDWKADNTAADLPLFGSIGYMYLSLVTYLTIQYEDKTTLWDHVIKLKSVQQDIFNLPDNEKHAPEYPWMKASITADNQDDALLQILDMIDGITDQGEGHGVTTVIREVAERIIKDRKKAQIMLQKVQKKYQPSEKALQKDYPAYNDKGEKLEGKSKDGYARSSFGAVDHFDTFRKVKELLDAGQIKTWTDWHADPENEWTADMLKTATHTADKYSIPSAEDVAGALNRLKKDNGDSNEQTMSGVVAGAIKGVTSVLNDFFSNQKTSFPFPSMSGSGDRMSLFWAIFGKAPDLSLGVENKVSGLLYHACQGLALDPNTLSVPNSCAPVAVYHTCKRSNSCAAEGGCGFVQTIQGGSSCGSSSTVTPPIAPSRNKVEMLKATTGPSPDAKTHEEKAAVPTTPVYYGAPSDNRCQSFGGCAVPISASQIFPVPDSDHKEQTTGHMELFNFIGSRFQPEPINFMAYQAGDLVYDVAWNAFIAVLQERNRPIPAKPKPSDIRLAFPPST